MWGRPGRMFERKVHLESRLPVVQAARLRTQCYQQPVTHSLQLHHALALFTALLLFSTARCSPLEGTLPHV